MARLFRKKKEPLPWELTPEDKIKEKEIVIPHVRKLYKQLKEKNALSFWVVADDPKFKRFGEGKAATGLRPFIKENKRYWGKNLANVRIIPKVHGRDELEKKYNIWIIVGIDIWPVDAKGNILSGGGGLYTMCWDTKDFGVSRLTFRLLQQIVIATDKKLIINANPLGTPLVRVVKLLKEKKFDISEYLIPLAGM